jgi:tetratricopeptide (TPR) repeat protein
MTEAEILLREALRLDPDYAEASRWLAFNRWGFWSHRLEGEGGARTEALALARRAAVLDPTDAGNRWVLGYVLAYEKLREESDAHFEAALALDPNCADAWAIRSELFAYDRPPGTAVEMVRRAMRLNPHPSAWYHWMLGLALYAAGDYTGAVAALSRRETHRTRSRCLLAASLAMAGRVEEARREAAFFAAADPAFRIGVWAVSQPARDEATVECFWEGCRRAGLPE